MQELRAILIDDEQGALDLLKLMIEENFNTVKVVAVARSVADGIRLIEEHAPDVIFLDIMMPDGTGFHLLEKIDHSNVQIVFTTAYEQYGVKAFEYAAIHYLLKPLCIDELGQAIGRLQQRNPADRISDVQIETLRHNVNTQAQKLALPNQHGFDMILIDDLIRCEADHGYTRFILINRPELIVSKPIHVYERMLADRYFFRAHRKHLINLRYVSAFVKGKPGYVVMQDGSTLEVSVRRREELLLELEQIVRF